MFSLKIITADRARIIVQPFFYNPFSSKPKNHAAIDVTDKARTHTNRKAAVGVQKTDLKSKESLYTKFYLVCLNPKEISAPGGDRAY